MTELIISGVSVELSSQFSIAVKRENPFFTKSGEYTYDVELSLESPVNAQLYGFLHRINSVADVDSKRRAVLIADNRVYCDGTEVITGWTDKSVKIQLVSGNSEMNYLADDKLLISAVPMCSTPVSAAHPDKDYIYKSYPDVSFCLPFVRGAAGPINRWRFDRSHSQHDWTGSETPSEFDFIPQPFLCAYIRELIKGMGYTFSRNDLEDSFAKYAFLVHSQPTFNWNEMLPGMTVREFLNAVEKTFNVSFRTDFRKKNVQLLLNNSYFTGGQASYVTNVIDEYECDTEDADGEIACNTSDDYTLEYDFPSTQYYQNARVSDLARKTAMVYSPSPVLTFDDFFEANVTSSEKIYQVNNILDPARQFGKVAVGTHEEWSWKYVDFFREFKRGEGNNVIKMPIIPAEIQRGIFISSGLTGDKFEWECNMVVAEDSIARKDKEVSLDDLLAMSKSEEGSSRLRIALYRGCTAPTANDEQYPEAFTDYTFDGKNHSVPVPTNVNPPISLRPGEMQKAFFADAYKIDLRHPVRISSFDVNLYDASTVFLIRNKRFLCREIEYTIGPIGRVGPWSGIFYPVKLSDTEAYSRWILADGKWRDGGVWLDDGRWLDD